MTNKTIQQHTDTVNELLNQPGVLHPMGCQYRWANEQDTAEELWLICGSFINDINHALSSFDRGKLEAQLNYGGILIDGQHHSTPIRLNNKLVSDDWLLQLRKAIDALYLYVCSFHLNHDLVSFCPLSLPLKTSVLALRQSQTKALLQNPKFSSILAPYAYDYDSNISEHGVWVSSIRLIIVLKKLRHHLELNPFLLLIQTNLLIAHIDKTLKTLTRFYALTMPFFVSNDQIKKDFEFPVNQDYQAQNLNGHNWFSG
ncbi:hypothetical protein MD535_22205 [Vibrio sp. ZSDZ65]|uniref:Uncharacterized protein n=1 Tax=Vibrio qingdaonensis TaxID=2829491 RepID=A0A9X3CUI8_9VIBR|nr:hypothetical protein [Vibrio qingdaonensis]MCW8348705.1 hypothetical protein [Vibrio qingdaonensis]